MTQFYETLPILVIDDEQETIKATLETLKDSTIQVISATSVEQALENLSATDIAFIIIDIQLSETNGLETAASIRKNHCYAEIPVLLVASFTQWDASGFDGLSVGTFDILFKPLDPEVLKCKIALFTDLYRNKKQLEQYKAMFDMVPTSIIVIDSNGLITDINNYHIEKIASGKAQKSDYIGTNIIHHPSIRGTHTESLYHKLLKGTPLNEKEVYFSQVTRGTEAYLNIKGVPLMKNNEFMGAVLTHEDVTERKLSNDELRQSKIELENLTSQLEDAISRANLMAAEAEMATMSKSDFLANMSHEIRTPLNAIVGLTEIVLKTPLSPEQEEYLNSIRLASDSFTELINDILDFSKIEAGKLDLECIPFSPVTIAEDVMLTLGIRAYEKKLDLGFDCDPKVPASILGDPVRLKQILMNLTGNAIKFTEEGEVVIRITCDRNSISDTVLRFSVLDTGIGIPLNKQKKIFEAFSQANDSTTREYGGTGLGLAISSHLAGMLGGDIWIESPNPESVKTAGSVFHFTIKTSLPETRISETDTDIPSSLSGKTIVVMEDNPRLCAFICNMISQSGMVPVSAYDEKQILKVLKTLSETEKASVVILLDADIPEFNLDTTTRRIIDMVPSATLVPMVQPSAVNTTSQVKSLPGVVSWISKPVRPSNLLKTIARICDTDAGKHKTARNIQPEPDSESFSILLVEDNKLNQKVAGKMLSNLGHTITIANNGKEAVEFFSQEEEPSFDLIFMDSQMPVMDGFEATRIIRKIESDDSSKQRTPIIALTAEAMKDDRKRFIDADMDDYVAKPVRSEALSTIITHVMKRKKEGKLIPAGPVSESDTPEF